MSSAISARDPAPGAEAVGNYAGAAGQSFGGDATQAAKRIDCIYIRPSMRRVFCVDEESAIQAPDRLDPVLPMSPGRAERPGFEYYRHGTLSLYAALDVRSGKVHGKTADRHTSDEFVKFLQEVVELCKPKQDIHVILDNLSAHKTHKVASFLQITRS